MATRLRIFSRLQNVFNRQHFSINNNIFLKQNSLFMSTSSSLSGGFSKVVLILGGLGIGGGLYGYLTAPDKKRGIAEAVSLSERDYVLNYEIPEIKPSREVHGPTIDLDLDLTLYQYQTCPFCCKVRAFLEFYGIPFKVIEVNPVMRQQIKFTSYKKVPILIAEEKKDGVKFQLNDSTAIISILGTHLLDTNGKLEDVLKSYVPNISKDENGKQVEEVLNRYFLMFGNKSNRRTDESITKERKWRKWADDDLVHMLSPNIYRTYDEALQAFNYFSEVGEWEKNFSTWERLVVVYVGATAMYFVGKRLKKRHALKEDVRQSLYDSCNQWMKAIGTKQKFLGGDLPNLADLAVFGLLSSIEGCLAFQDLLANTKIGTWYYNVKEVVSNHGGYQMLR